MDLTSEIEVGAVNREDAEKLVAEFQAFADGIKSEADRSLLKALQRAVASEGLRLPPMPQAVLRVQRLLDSPNASFRELAHQLELDPALATKMVGIANSPFYHGMEPARSVQDAVVRIGLRETRNIIMAITLRSKLFRVPGFEVQTRTLWHHSMAASISSQAIAAEVGCDPDPAFLCGLTHDLGRVVIFSFAGEVGRRTRGRLNPDPGTLRSVLERFHARLSGVAAASWRFAPELVAAIAHHHNPEDAPQPARELAGVLAAGNRLAHWLTEADAETLPSDKEWVRLTSPVCLDPDLKGELLPEVSDTFQKLLKSL